MRLVHPFTLTRRWWRPGRRSPYCRWGSSWQVRTLDGRAARSERMSFKVIDGDGPGKEERDLERNRERAMAEFSWAIRDAAANMLRIIRGAGKPYELLIQMRK